MPVKQLPEKPSLKHLRHQARDILHLLATGDMQTAQRIREFHPRFRKAADEEIFAANLKLSDAQLTIAREYGFDSWPKLTERIGLPADTDDLSKPHHERIVDPIFRRAVDLLDEGDVQGLRAHLETHPGLAHQRVHFPGGNYFRNPCLLEFTAENPIRHRTLPANVADIARVILEAGAKQDSDALDGALGLVSTGCIARQCQVQVPLIHLLCDYGANPSQAIGPAVVHGEFEAVKALIARGAELDLPVAAGMGEVAKARELLMKSDEEKRHRALALASQFGHLEIVKMLLDAGENPNRYNPVGCHSHSTPLHQASLAGHEDVVRLLVDGGARTDLKDTLWQGTAADWARHAHRDNIEQFLRS